MIWAQVLNGGSFIGSFTTMEVTGGFCHFYQRQNHSVAEQEDSFCNSPPNDLLFLTWCVSVYGMCYRKTDLDLEKLQLFRKAWDTNQPANREHCFNVTSALLTNSQNKQFLRNSDFSCVSG